MKDGFHKPGWRVDCNVSFLARWGRVTVGFLCAVIPPDHATVSMPSVYQFGGEYAIEMPLHVVCCCAWGTQSAALPFRKQNENQYRMLVMMPSLMLMILSLDPDHICSARPFWASVIRIWGKALSATLNLLDINTAFLSPMLAETCSTSLLLCFELR